MTVAQLRAERRAAGNCIECDEPTPAVTGAGRCERHREARRLYMAAWRAGNTTSVKKPRAKKWTATRHCRGCGEEFVARRDEARYCSNLCWLRERAKMGRLPKPTTAGSPVRPRAPYETRCACSSCVRGRAEAQARKAAREAAGQPLLTVEAFQAWADRVRVGRAREKGEAVWR